MSTVIATVARPNDAWLRIIIASLLNYVSFINATKALEPTLAPFRDSQGALGSTSSRTWSARKWRVIKIQVFGMGVALALAISQLASSETEPYFLVLECFSCLATKLVANGLSLRRPRGKWQSLSTKTTDVLTEFQPFEHLPSPYKAPISLFVALLLGLWKWTLSTLPVAESAIHAIKRDIPSNTGSEWGSSLTSAVIGAGVTLACHVHRTLLDHYQRTTNAAVIEQQRVESEKLTATLIQLAVLAEKFLGSGTLAVEAHRLTAALNQQLTTNTQQLSTTSTLHHCKTNGQSWVASGNTGSALESRVDCIEMDNLPAQPSRTV
ncbi:hypothetical protein GT037_007361 [Alternaria burnsii]|uniref:Uncharacterized protein n=1 Tax=Alternaria burnsii TaxID=1187904 RepID=A0A8H7B8A5_9PLEO|nr:uncharacterized protein GT037_007361 [Alternaria burnsii]KAF7674601.1 hypothetical protein GT037_007361 [Alternaria burnsii]